jgi:hypothetical protein
MHPTNAYDHHCGDFEEPQPDRARRGFGKHAALQCDAAQPGY